MSYPVKTKKIILFILLAFFAYLYIETLYPGIGGRLNYGDSVKWQYLWLVNGTPHSTGYPLFLIITKLFGNLLTFLDIPYRITSISLLFALLTLYTLYRISGLIIQNTYAQFLPILLLGGSVSFWSEATEAEVYTLNAFFVSLIIYFAIKYYQTKTTKYFFVLVSIYALSFGNHLTMIMLFPALLYITYITNPKFLLQRKTLLWVSLIAILGASQYLYILYLSYSSDSFYLEYIGKETTISNWLGYITGSQFNQEIGENLNFVQLYFNAIPTFLNHLWVEFGLILLILFIVVKRYYCTIKYHWQPIYIFLLLIVIVELLNALSYNIFDIVVYYIPIFLVLSLLLAKTVDILPVHIQAKLVVILIASILFLISKRYDTMLIKVNPNAKISSYFHMLPPNSKLYIPAKGYYDYYGYEALKYAELVDFKNKHIHYISHITINEQDNYTSECNLSSIKDEPFFYKKDKGQTAQFINSTIDLNGLKTFYIPDFTKEIIPTECFKATPLIDASNLGELINRYKDKLIIISAKDEAKHKLDRSTIKTLKKVGLKDINTLKFRGSYIAVIHNDKILYELVDNKKKIILLNKTDLTKLGIQKIVSAGKLFGNKSSIIYNNQELSRNTRGLNIVIINEDTIFPLNIDTHKTTTFKSPLYKVEKNEISAL